MSAVVLRCPNCGTTRATPGECEACHAAQARYFCTNHTPGRWLEAPACPQCGARFGEPERAPPAPSFRAPPAPPARRPTASGWAEDARPSPESWPPAEDDVSGPHYDEPATHMPGWQARRMPPTAKPELEVVPVARGLGCLVRFVLIMVVLLFALVSVVFLFGGSLLQVFLSY